MCDDDDVVREDTIEYSFFEEFGYDETKDFNIFDTITEAGLGTFAFFSAAK